jgi:hypothetical protein
MGDNRPASHRQPCHLTYSEYAMVESVPAGRQFFLRGARKSLRQATRVKPGFHLAG